MHLCSIKKQTGDKVSRRDFLFKFATELREVYIVEDQAETLLLLDLSDYRQLLKNTKAEKRKQRQIAANCTQNKTSKQVQQNCMWQVQPPRSFSNALYSVCDNANMNIFQFYVHFVLLPSSKTVFYG